MIFFNKYNDIFFNKYNDIFMYFNFYYLIYLLILNNNMIIDIKSFIKICLKYVIEGFIIAICALYIPTFYKASLRKPTINEVFSIGLTASLTMVLLDYFSKTTSFGARFGIGFGIGQNLIL